LFNYGALKQKDTNAIMAFNITNFVSSKEKSQLKNA